MSLVQDTIIDEIKKGLVRAKDFRDQIVNAKTEAKRLYFQKKLRKNNINVAQLLEALERIKNNRKDEPNDHPDTKE